MNRFPAQLEAALDGGDTVVTATPQQAVAIRRAWGRRQSGRGLRAWPTPKVFPLAVWLARAWRQAAARDTTGQLPRLLTPTQERALWERIVQSGDSASRYLQPAGLASAVMRAWQRMHDWDIDSAELADVFTEEAQSLRRWTQLFRRQTHTGGWIDAARALWQLPLPASAEPAGEQASQQDATRGWLGVGFEVPTAALTALIGRLRERQVDARLLEHEHRPPAAVRISPADPEAELRAAAGWSRSRLLADPQARLLVIVPDLDRQRAPVQRIFDEILLPPALTLNASADMGRPYVMEGGVPLSGYPLASAALTALELACGPLPFDQVSRWLRSPFLFAGAERADAMAVTDLALREVVAPELDLAQLREALHRVLAGGQSVGQSVSESVSLTGDQAAKVGQACTRFVRQLDGRRRLLSLWCEAINAALAALGWPGSRALDSAEYQTLEKFHAALGELATLDEVVGRIDCAGAVAQLRRVLQGTLFQPQTPECPLEISSRLGDPGLNYDGIWVAGLHAAAWPRAPRLDPFIPWQAQLAAGMPDASAAATLAAAQAASARLLSAAPQVIVSWPRRLDDEEALPSPLIADLPEAGPERSSAQFSDPAGQSADLRAVLLESARKSSAVQLIDDGQAPPLQLPARVRGGARTLALQSQCPFRAFAEQRLGADVPDQPQPGIDAATRGIFTHRVLNLFWDEADSQARLSALDEPARQRLCMQAVTQAAREVLEASRRWAPALIELECTRLLALLREFITAELSRPPFRVVAAEERMGADISGLQLQLTVDRIDELQDGRRLVIDYKTGGITPRAWHGERPDDPQLPLYAVVTSPSPAAVAFSFLRADGCSYEGAGEAPAAMPGLEISADWPAQLQEWRTVLERLAGEFAAGVAAVDPSSRRVCSYCHLHALCRIEEIDGPAVEDEDVG